MVGLYPSRLLNTTTAANNASSKHPIDWKVGVLSQRCSDDKYSTIRPLLLVANSLAVGLLKIQSQTLSPYVSVKDMEHQTRFILLKGRLNVLTCATTSSYDMNAGFAAKNIWERKVSSPSASLATNRYVLAG